MSGPQFLTDEQLAQYFVQATGLPRRGVDPITLEPRVQSWLERSNMAHRRALPIALEVAKIADAPAPLPTPEQPGDQQPLSEDELADRIRGMDMRAWAQERQRLGLYKSTIDHLAGA